MLNLLKTDGSPDNGTPKLLQEVFIMNVYESLEDEACKDNIDIIPYHFRSDNLKGLYCNGVIGLNKDLDTTQEKACFRLLIPV